MRAKTTKRQSVEREIVPATTLQWLSCSGGSSFGSKFGQIPKLDMSSHNLADRLKRNFNVTLAELVEDVS